MSTIRRFRRAGPRWYLRWPPRGSLRWSLRRSAGDIVAIARSPIALLAACLLTFAAGALLDAGAARAHGRSVSYSSWEIDERGADVSLRMALLELSRLGPVALPSGSFAAADEAQTTSARHDPNAETFIRALTLSRGGMLCMPRGAVRRFTEREGWVRYAWRVECPEERGELAIQSRVLLDVSPSHLHFARVRMARAAGAAGAAGTLGAEDANGANDAVRERVLTEAAPRFVLRSEGDVAAQGASDASGAQVVGPGGPDAVEGSRFRDYLELGIRHILSGWDHLAFLFGLMLLCDRAVAIARLVTGFTLAHSLTLALTVLGLVHPRAAAVEAVIAFSVALVAIEKGWLVAGRGRAIPAAVLGGLAGLGGAAAAGASALPGLAVVGLMLFTVCHFALAARRDAEWTRIALTFAFGLVHGFGFAGILLELTLPPERLVPALVGFNLGVELGQLAVVALAWPLLVAAERLASPFARRWARDLAVAGLCGLGCFWLARRTLAF